MIATSIDALFARSGLELPVRAIACAQVAVAAGDWPRVEQAVQAARRAGCPRAALEEGLLQGVLFYGFPRTVTAFEVLAQAWPIKGGAPSGGALPQTEQKAAGRALFATIYGRNAAAVAAMLASYHGELHDFVLEVAYGRILSRPGLSPRDRELTAVAVLAAMQQTPQLVAHARGAMRLGGSIEAVREALVIGLGGEDAAVDVALAKIVRVGS